MTVAIDRSDGRPTGDDARHHVVIVGGGAAGLELATALSARLGRGERGHVSLVDGARTHLWKPLLHSVAAGTITPSEHELDYLALGHRHGFRFHLGALVGLDRAKKQIQLAATHDEDGAEITPSRTVSYDTLVIAIGSVANDFGTPGVAAHAVPLDTTEQAKRFHRLLVDGYLRAQTQAEPLRPGQLTIVVVGAGATGVELVAELHRSTRDLVAFGFDRIDPDHDIRLVLVEGANRILPSLPDAMSRSTAETLKGLGVDVRTGASAAEVRADGVRLADGSFIASALVVWTAGVRASETLSHLDGLEANRNHQLVVDETLRTTLDASIFAIGDCAQCRPPDATTAVPPRAQAAHQEASHLARQLIRRLDGKPLQPFAYRDFGSLASLSRYKAIGYLMGFVGRDFWVQGLIARLMYRALYLMHERAVEGGRASLASTLARALSRSYQPAIKLH